MAEPHQKHSRAMRFFDDKEYNDAERCGIPRRGSAERTREIAGGVESESWDRDDGRVFNLAVGAD